LTFIDFFIIFIVKIKGKVMDNYICHSGGCPGSDMTWENESAKYGVETVAYSFYNHVQDSLNQKILSLDELDEGYEAVLIADKTLKRYVTRIMYPYVKNLLSRNWFQVKNSEAIFPIGMFANKKQSLVSGGTGWAVQMAVDNKKDIFFFEQPSKSWYKYDYKTSIFQKMYEIPKLTKNFAGIGTRKINDDGINAIRDVLKNTFGNMPQ